MIQEIENFSSFLLMILRLKATKHHKKEVKKVLSLRSSRIISIYSSAKKSTLWPPLPRPSSISLSKITFS
jgi:hypothetical protein